MIDPFPGTLAKILHRILDCPDANTTSKGKSETV
jgi:hypothetical protein